jgi:large subunit ribosomal protein L13
MNENLNIDRQWHLIDASGKVLGRIATEAARLLMGKNKPIFTRHLDLGDYVIITNAARVRLTGKKMKEKVYFRHSGYPGGLKSITAEKLLQSQPTRLIEKAVKGMLPHNRLGQAIAKKLKVYAGETHPHQAQLSFESTREPAVAKKEKDRVPTRTGAKGQRGGKALIKEKEKARVPAKTRAKSQPGEKASAKKGGRS